MLLWLWQGPARQGLDSAPPCPTSTSYIDRSTSQICRFPRQTQPFRRSLHPQMAARYLQELSHGPASICPTPGEPQRETPTPGRRCQGTRRLAAMGDGHAARHQQRRAPIPPLAKDSQAVPLCSSVPPPSLPRSQPAPLRASPPPFCAILVSISRFFDSLSSPSNKVTLQSHRHSAPTLPALSRTQLFKRLHCSSEPANYSLSPKYRPENTEFRSRGNNFPLVRNHLLGESQKAVSVLGL